MQNTKQMELEILIAIRNNQTIPAYEFHKLFDHNWPDFRKSMDTLYDQRLFIISSQDKMPGSHILELTPEGNRWVTKLLSECTNEIHMNLSGHKQVRNLETSTRWSSLFGIIDLVSAFSFRFKRQIR